MNSPMTSTDLENSYRGVSDYFDATAKDRERWIDRNAGYNRELLNVLKQYTPPGSRVLEIGCSTGKLLSWLNPSVGVGIDLSRGMVEEARRQHPNLRFEQGFAETFRMNEKFERIIIADTVCFIRDLQATLENVRHVCTHQTRVIITTYNYFWLPILRFLEKAGLKMPLPASNWISRNEIVNVLTLADFEIIKSDSATIVPARLPLIAGIANRFLAHLPGLRRLGLIQYVVARPLHLEPRREKTVSVIVPARNESGNIDLIVNEIEELGAGTEIIFVEGHSTDDTWQAIQAAVAKNRDRKIVAIQQKGKGKWDAVRAGFSAATGDILMIFDADRTVPASDLGKFYEAIASNRAEFISGDRFVYPMQQEAMPFFNVLGNRFFAGVFSWMLNQRIQDTLCGTKVILRSTFARLERILPEFGGIDPFGDYDLILGAARLNLKFATIPIRYRSRTYGKSNISPWSDSLLLFQICWIAVRRLRFF